MTGEFATIGLIRKLLGEPDDPEELWLGDDAAAVKAEAGWLLLTADTAVSGVHADLELTSPPDFGYKALAAAVSDVAAMGGTPAHALITVTAPPGTDLADVYRGIFEASGDFSCPVVGGDITTGPCLVVTAAVTGRVEGGRPVRRDGARPGDTIWVTGALGAAAAGLRLLRSGRGASNAAEAEAVGVQARPKALLTAGRAARAAGATAMIDVSDGLAADLGHLADSSGVGFELDEVPVHPAARLEEALGGGEDYALVFCADPSAPVLETFAGLDTPMPIGRCTADPARRLYRGRRLEPAGWEHHW